MPCDSGMTRRLPSAAKHLYRRCESFRHRPTSSPVPRHIACRGAVSSLRTSEHARHRPQIHRLSIRLLKLGNNESVLLPADYDGAVLTQRQGRQIGDSQFRTL